MKKREDLSANEKAFLSNLSQTLEMDRHFLQQKYPFIGNVLMRLPTEIVDNNYPETAATDGRIIMVNPIFVSGLTEEERQFVLAHEVMHCVMMHRLREKGRNHDLWNIATDLEIHFLLLESGLKPPFVLPHDPHWNGLNAEEIYDKLENEIEKAVNKAKNGENDGENGENDSENGEEGDKNDGKEDNSKKVQVFSDWCNDGKESKNIKSGGKIDGTSDVWKSFDDILDKDKAEKAGETEEELNKSDEEIEQEILEKVMAATKTAGTVPGKVTEFINSMTKREVPWRELLAQYVTSSYSDSTQWLPPSRRHVWRDMYLPSRHSESLRCVVGLDTSGSTAEVLPKFFTELESLLNTFGKYEVTVIQCDYGIQSVETYTSDTGIPREGWKASGFGGTSFVPVFNYVNEHIGELNPNCLIYLTDGYGDAPDNPPPYPVMWIISPGGYNSCPYGTVAHMKNSENL